MQLTTKRTSAALALLAGAQISLAAPQLQHNTLKERQDGVGLLIQKFPDSNCGVSLEENKFRLDPTAAVSQSLCIQNTFDAGSIRMVEQPSQNFICTFTTWSGSDCRGSNSRARAGTACQVNLPFASFTVDCSPIIV